MQTKFLSLFFIAITCSVSQGFAQESCDISSYDLNSCDSVFNNCEKECCIDFSLTQTADYGTNLTLPIGLTPLNTPITGLGGLGAIGGGILNDGILGDLGLLDNLGLGGIGGAPPIPVADVPTIANLQDDFGYQTTANFSYQKSIGEDGLFTTYYSYYQNLHNRVKELDLVSHTVSLQYAHALTDTLTAAFTYSFAHYELEWDPFINQNNASVALAYRPDNFWSLEGTFNYTNSDYANFTVLDADYYAETLSLTRYLDENQLSYLQLSGTLGQWNANNSTFSYDLYSIAATLGIALDDEGDTNLVTSGSYGNYDFRGTDFIQQDRTRDDMIYVLSTTLSRKLSDSFTVFGQYSYTASDSNVQRQDYDSNFFSIGGTLTR